MRKLFKRPILSCIIILLIVCVIGLVSGLLQYLVFNPSRSYTSASYEFLYDGASKGLDPNGEVFDPIDFVTEDVISESLSNLGYESKYEAKDILTNLSVKAYVPKGILKQITSYDSLVDTEGATTEILSNSYHATRYSFILYNDFDKKLSKDKVNELLEEIIKNYTNAFYECYKNNYDLTNYGEALPDIDDAADYIYQVQSLSTKFSLLSKYANELYNRHNEFSYNNLSFRDISLKCSSIVSNDVAKINYSINLNALSKDLNRLKDYYNYKILDLNYYKVKYESDLASLTSIVNSYKKDSTIYISSGDSVIKVDSNSASTYDALLQRKLSLSASIENIKTRINDYTNRLADIEVSTTSTDEYTLLENNISKLSTNYNNLEQSFKELLEEYNKQYVLNGTVKYSKAGFSSNSIISGSFIVTCIKSTAPLVLVTLLAMSCVCFVRNVKKNKEEE